MRIVFMGTPDFATGTLELLVASEHEIIGVVTQPDKPKGRGKALMPTPVKQVAMSHGIKVFQPVKVRDPEFIQVLKALKPDAVVVVAFGQIIPQAVLDIPKYGCINVHGSLLPKYRGAAPIQWAVLDGEAESGVTIMRMDAGLDTGDMISKVVIPLDRKETGGSLFDKLSKAGADLLVKTLNDIENGTASYEKQPCESSTEYAKMIDKKMGEIDWNQDAAEIEQLIRGLNPWPSAYTYLNGKSLKIWDADVLADETKEGQNGQVLRIGKDGLDVQTQQGIIRIRELQLEGKKRMDADSFLRGYAIETNTKLGK